MDVNRVFPENLHVTLRCTEKDFLQNMISLTNLLYSNRYQGDYEKDSDRDSGYHSHGNASANSGYGHQQRGAVAMSLNPFTNLPYTPRYYELYRYVLY